MKSSNDSLKRLFIGVPLPVSSQAGREYISLQNKFNEVLHATWTRLEQWHITLHFFGEIFSREIPDIVECMNKSFENFHVQQLSIKHLGFFGKRENPRVLWLGLEPIEEIVYYQKNLTNVLSQKGYEIEDRPFSPHVTLARIKKIKDVKKFHFLVDQFSDLTFAEIAIDRVNLYESILRSHGPEYIPLHTHNLKVRGNERKI